jgi:uncharacterized membrane protein YqhA
LVAGLFVLLVTFVQLTISVVSHVLTTDGDTTLVDALGPIDLALVGSLVLMVAFAVYENLMNVEHLADRAQAWGLMAFVVSVALLAVMDHPSGRTLA